MKTLSAAGLKRIRSALGLTQAELAASIGWHPLTISKWETGDRPVSLKATLAIQRLAETARA